MGGGPRDLLSVARCAPFVTGWPAILRYALSGSRDVTLAFAQVVRPLVAEALPDPQRAAADRVLLSTSLKVALAMSAYARIAAVQFDPALAALGSSFTRVYDDLFDHFQTVRLAERLDDMFGGRPFEAASPTETLLHLIWRAINARLGRPATDPMYEIVRRMHRFQCRSRGQTAGAVLSTGDLRSITEGKGGFGATALFALLRPRMPEPEQAVLVELGDLLQLLDDHHDLAEDRAAGVVTEVTEGHSTLADIGRRVRRVHRALRAYYPGRPVRRMSGILLLMMLGAVIRQRADRRPPRRPPRPAVWRTHRLLFARAGNLVETPRPARGEARK